MILVRSVFGLLLSLGAAALTTNSSQDHDPYKLSLIPSDQKPRVFVLTDILNEPDDQQSVVRYLLYSNEFNTRALCATTSTHLRNETNPGNIEHIVNAYGQVVENLNRHVHPWNQYSSGDDMRKLITSGPTVYGRKAFEEPISEGAQLLIDRLQESTEPLWVLVWGGPNTLAQALYHLDKNVTESEFAILRSRLRVYAISDQDDTGEWIRYNWPDIFYIVSIHGFTNYFLATWRGMWEGIPDLSLYKTEHEWLAKHIEIGPLGAVYPRRPVGIEGDTPSFLYLIQNGLGEREDPRQGSWGGRWLPINHGSRVYADGIDVYYSPDGSTNETSNKASCARWRDHFQNDMAARMQWSISEDFANGTHQPVPSINGSVGPNAIRVTARPGDSVYLDASGTYDPDHTEDNSRLTFEWFQYLESGYQVRGTVRPYFNVELEATGDGETVDPTLPTDAGFRPFTRGTSVKVTVPDLAGVEFEYSIILQVTNNKNPDLPIRRYQRVKILTSENNINPDECCYHMIVPEYKGLTWYDRENDGQ